MNYRFRAPKRPVSRVFLHCSASDNPAHDNVATMDLWHKQRGWAGVGYHFFIRKSGELEIGRDLEITPAAQEGNNKGTIAICLHGLKSENFTAAQYATVLSLCQQINNAYGGAVTFHGHCEVARKACPVFDYKRVLGLSAGKLPRDPTAPNRDISMPRMPGIEHLEEPSAGRTMVLKHGDKSGGVFDVQKRLSALGYFVGKIEGDFGDRTRAAVLAFQADNHLIADGKVGPATREAMKDAKPRVIGEQRAGATLKSLAAEGSAAAKASTNNRVAGFALAGGGLLGMVEKSTGAVTEVAANMGVFSHTIERFGPALGWGVVAVGLYVAYQSILAGREAVRDHRTGRRA
ncbi:MULTISPECIES: peptidoglycan-binding domain-containing protein [unclassified Ensifer]|uniref:peptidoglycan recognition protein family protein n=1 Tax=unclassified Ensifer TaxID=2633371 RepID=UPI000813D74F|nr:MULTISPECIES: peptidoglycan-binding domain-containing protein [unclassified Ensifer]OCP17388.1 hypothetical protein BC361_07975 [Ensifer sp. LC54]OCP28707.1 hypothetical protein BC363_02385 [Ensifer sp. LC384]